ncbi:hypothetical protein BH10BDE1_BH10BDE1_25670 [soil metagenome]
MTLKLLTLTTLTISIAIGGVSQAAGIFTLRGKLKSFNEATYEIQTKSMIYEIKKTGLSEAQVAEMKTKKTGQEVELVVETEAVAKVRDLK